MTSAIQKRQYFKLQLFSGVALSVVLALAVFSDVAWAQNAGMRSTLDPESRLTQSPLGKTKKKLRQKKLQETALNPAVKYTTETQSDADVEAEAFQRLYGDDTSTTDAEQSNGDKPTAKPRRKATTLSELEPDANDSLIETPKDPSKSTKGKKPMAKNGKAVANSKGQKAVKPGLDDQTTGTLVVRKGQKATMLRAQRTLPTEAVQSRELTEEENPFKAVGIRLGSITLRPTIEQGIEATTNGSGSAGGSSAINSITTLRLDGISDWRNGSLEGSGFVTLRNSLSGKSEDDPEAGASFKMTQPVLRDWAYTIGGSYGLKRESAVSGTAFPATIINRPLAQDIRLSLGIGKSDGILQPSAKLEYGRTTFGDATDTLGAAVSQSDRDQTSLRGTFRLGTEISPALTPFVEIAYGKTWRDEAVDVFLNDRSSTELRASIGAEINPSEKLNGEISVGWLRQTFDNAGLDDIDGVALAAALNWSPVQGTKISAGLSTSAEPANSATVSGSMLYAATLGVTHQLSQRLSTSANFGASYRDFTGSGGSDTTLSAELAATYMVNRTLGVNAKVRHESVSSSDPMRESDTTTLLLGLKIQR